MAWHAIEAILVLWAVDELGLGAGTLGLLLSVGSVGAVWARCHRRPRSAHRRRARDVGLRAVSSVGVLTVRWRPAKRRW